MSEKVVFLCIIRREFALSIKLIRALVQKTFDRDIKPTWPIK